MPKKDVGNFSSFSVCLRVQSFFSGIYSKGGYSLYGFLSLHSFFILEFSPFAFFIHLWPSPLLISRLSSNRPLLFGELLNNTTPIRYSRFASPLSLQSSYFITFGRTLNLIELRLLHQPLVWGAQLLQSRSRQVPNIMSSIGVTRDLSE